MDPDRIEAALDGLGAESRALVELSIVRDVADDDIAGLLGTDEGSVRSRREDALAQLATSLGAQSGEEVGQLMREMRELPETRWRGEGDAEPETIEPAPTPAPAPEPTRVIQPGQKRRRRALPALLGGLMVACLVAVLLALSSGSDDEEEPAAPADAPAAEPAPEGEPVKLDPVAGGKGKGTARLSGGNIELSVSGLPDSGEGGYVTWLYNSLAEARPLNRPQKGSAFELRTKLPEGSDRFRFVDVSLEPEDGDRNHSGQSVLRLPLSSLR